jgi:hypothetical protein
MAESLTELKRKAVKAGMDMAVARKADRDALQNFIDKSVDPDGKKVAKVAPVKKKKVSKVAAPKKRGRPLGSKNRPKDEPKPVKQAAQKRAPKNGKVENGEVGRAIIGRIDYSIEDENWNPRKGSPVDRIWRSLKKNRDDVDKVFNELLSDLWDFVGREKRNGEKRSKAEAEAVLKYRINRTRFEYAVRTGQHKVATNRVQYGTGTYAKNHKTRKRTTTKQRVAKAAPERIPKQRTRKVSRTRNSTPAKKKNAGNGWQPGSRGRIPASATKAQIKEHERLRRERLAR